MVMKVIVTGATGMVGEGVLLECLAHPQIESVLSVQRRPGNKKHPKLKELLLPDFFQPESIAGELRGYDACLFCLGVSAIGRTEEEYFKQTYTLTMGFARLLARENPGMIFCYISGSGTDSSEKGTMRWARVKGKTENDLMGLPFRKVYAFRPGYLQPTPGQSYALPYYKYVSWMFPVLRLLTPSYVSTLKQLGLAMIQACLHGYPKNILEVKDILSVSSR